MSVDTGTDRWGESLSRRLGLWSAVAVVIGSTIGSGIFRTPASVADKIGDVPLFIIAWIAGGVLALCGALTYAELAALFPRSGGIYVYLREAFGPLTAFLFGWAELWIIRPGAFGAIGITASAYTLRTLGLDPAAPIGPLRSEQLLGAVYIAIVALVNYFGIHRGAILQNISTVLKSAALLILVVLGLTIGRSSGIPVTEIFSQHSTVQLSAFFLALVSILWAYDGWADLSFVGGEVRDPHRTMPRALVVGTAFVVILYLAANFTYLSLIPMSQMRGAELVAADVAMILFGSIGVVFVSAAIAVSTFGTLNGSMMTAPRIFFAMAEDGMFPKKIAKIDPETKAPTGAILLTAALGIIFVSIRTFTDLANQFVIGIWPFYALAVAAVFVLRRTRPDMDRPYRVWGYPFVPILFLLGSLLLLGNYLINEPLSFGIDLLLIVLGVPFYIMWRRLRKPEPR
ncbi:MAG TPA: amino acid permease [Acidobacteriota bacterium]|nr:amino acid permease [Acidobacteriota bacterium]